jgi:hypothetical protein
MLKMPFKCTILDETVQLISKIHGGQKCSLGTTFSSFNIEEPVAHAD